MAEDIISQRANFARQFIGSSGPTQRAQYRRDIEAAAQRDEERSALEFEQAQRNDPQLMNAVTGRAKENRMFREGIEKADLAEKRFNLDERKALSAEDLAKIRIGIQEKQLGIATRAEALKLQKEADEAEDTIAFEESEYNIRRNPKTPAGSDAYNQAVMNEILRRPHLKKDYRTAVLEQIGIRNPEEALKQGANAIAKGASRATVKADGITATFQKSPTEDLDKAQEGLTRLRQIWGKEKATGDASNAAYLEELIRKTEADVQKLGGIIGPQPGTTETPATQPTSTPASVPATQATTIWRTDSKGNRWEYDANKKPTGKYIPAK